MRLKQGALDGLCGIYAVLNSVPRWTGRRLSEQNRYDLFKKLLHSLDGERALGDIIVDGLTYRDTRKLVGIASKFTSRRLEVEASISPARACANVRSLGSRLRTHLAEERTSALMQFKRRTADGEVDYWHWTVVTAVTDSSLLLCDSAGLARIPLGQSSVGQSARYELFGHQLILIQGKPAKEA